jgi:antitoxin HicB
VSLRFEYPVELTIDEAGFVLAVFPDLPEAGTDGADQAEALDEAADCLATALAFRIIERKEIPPPSPARGRPTVTPGTLIAAKAALYLAMREQKVSKVALAKRLGCDEAEVRRLLNPRHASKIDRMDDALAALGKRLVVEVRAA